MDDIHRLYNEFKERGFPGEIIGTDRLLIQTDIEICIVIDTEDETDDITALKKLKKEYSEDLGGYIISIPHFLVIEHLRETVDHIVLMMKEDYEDMDDDTRRIGHF